MEDDLSKIVRLMETLYGLDISSYDDGFLEQTIEKRMASCQARDLSDYHSELSSNQAEAEKLFEACNITYTEFFRNPLTFAHLQQWLLPRLVEAKAENSEIRIWSAGCSSGQEAYSIAILLERIFLKKNKSVRYRIIATDISKSALALASQGEYSENEIQNIKMQDLKEFFVKSGDGYSVSKQLKSQVHFSTYDLLEHKSTFPPDSIFGNFDLAVCSNLLFYYKPQHQRTIMKKMINSITESGYLITGEAERQIIAGFGGIHIVDTPSAIFQKNGGTK